MWNALMFNTLLSNFGVLVHFNAQKYQMFWIMSSLVVRWSSSLYPSRSPYNGPLSIALQRCNSVKLSLSLWFPSPCMNTQPKSQSVLGGLLLHSTQRLMRSLIFTNCHWGQTERQKIRGHKKGNDPQPKSKPGLHFLLTWSQEFHVWENAVWAHVYVHAGRGILCACLYVGYGGIRCLPPLSYF